MSQHRQFTCSLPCNVIVEGSPHLFVSGSRFVHFTQSVRRQAACKCPLGVWRRQHAFNPGKARVPGSILVPWMFVAMQCPHRTVHVKHEKTPLAREQSHRVSQENFQPLFSIPEQTSTFEPHLRGRFRREYPACQETEQAIQTNSSTPNNPLTDAFGAAFVYASISVYEVDHPSINQGLLQRYAQLCNQLTSHRASILSLLPYVGSQVSRPETTLR